MKKVKTIIKEDTIREHARTKGLFDTILYEDIKLRIKKDKTPSNMLSALRKVFKDYYVGKDSYNEFYIFTIYTGDKETNEFLNKPIRGLKPESKSSFVKKCIDDLKKGINKEK